MNKKLLALAVAGALAAPLAAQADVTVYGKAHLSLDNVSSDSAAAERDLRVASRASRVGVKGAEDLGGGLKAVFQMEWQVDMSGDNASNQLAGDNNLSARNQIIGLAGGFGTLAIGRHDTPYKMSTGSLDPFADTAADFNTIIGTPVGLENRGNDVVAYLSPSFNGLNVNAAIIADNATDLATATSIAATYSNGPLFVSVAMEDVDGGQSGNRIGVSYDLGAAKIGGVIEMAESAAGVDYDAFLVNAVVPMGGGNAIIAEIGQGEFDGGTATTLLAVGAAHSMSKATSVYAAYGNVSADPAAGATVDTNILTVGVTHSF